MTTTIRSLHRPVSALLALAMAGCTSIRVNEHSYGGSGSAVSVRVVWDDAGTSRHVAGVTVALLRVGPDAPGPWATETTRADRGITFDDLPAGRYRVVLSARDMATVERTFDVDDGRRMSMRVLVEARAIEVEPGSPPAGGGDASAVAEGVVFVLKAVGTVILVVALVGVVVLLADLDDDDDDCNTCHDHARSDYCTCSCHD